jgi:hypothetical protein
LPTLSPHYFKSLPYGRNVGDFMELDCQEGFVNDLSGWTPNYNTGMLLAVDFKCNNGLSLFAGKKDGSANIIKRSVVCNNGFSEVDIMHGFGGIGSYTPYCNGNPQLTVAYGYNVVRTTSSKMTCPPGRIIQKISGTYYSSPVINSLTFYCAGFFV